MPEMLQRFSEGKKEKNTDKCAVERVRGTKGAPWKALGNDGKATIRTRNVGILLPRTRKSKEGFESRLKKNCRQEDKASGSWNRQPKNTWSKLNSVTTLTARKMMKKGFIALKSGD